MAHEYRENIDDQHAYEDDDTSEDCNCGLPNPHPGTPFVCRMHGAVLDVEEAHAELYPNGCPNWCEACCARLGGKRCERCTQMQRPGQSCICFDNDCQ